MTTTSSSFTRPSRGITALVGLLLLGGLLAACGSSNKTASPTSTSPAATGSATTNGSSSGANSSLSKIEALSSSVQGAEKATFKAVYTISDAGTTQSVTVEQAPPKSAFSTKGGDVIDTGTATYYCTDSGTSVCVNGGTSNPLAGLTQLFSPSTALTELKAVQSEAAADDTGYHISFSTESYGGESTTCANVSGTGGPVKYCVTKQGLLAYASSSSSTLTLSSYSSSAPASDFALPAGATVMTIPSGTP
ncbi:MAG TPA: hypothetical protein VIJ09_11235 [Acidimicrobiales bacterium]